MNKPTDKRNKTPYLWEYMEWLRADPSRIKPFAYETFMKERGG